MYGFKSKPKNIISLPLPKIKDRSISSVTEYFEKDIPIFGTWITNNALSGHHDIEALEMVEAFGLSPVVSMYCCTKYFLISYKGVYEDKIKFIPWTVYRLSNSSIFEIYHEIAKAYELYYDPDPDSFCLNQCFYKAKYSETEMLDFFAKNPKKIKIDLGLNPEKID